MGLSIDREQSAAAAETALPLFMRKPLMIE
jgi:hypothetical protein